MELGRSHTTSQKFTGHFIYWEGSELEEGDKSEDLRKGGIKWQPKEFQF